MDALPDTTAGPPGRRRLPASADLPPIPTLTRRQESYARCVATGMSYAEAFRQAGLVASSSGSMSGQIAVLNRTPAVRARIAELRIKADQETISTIAERMAWLRLIVQADPDELARIVHDPCDLCWIDEAVAAAYAAHFAPRPFDPADEPRPALPDTKRPNAECKHCRGEGHKRVVITPTDELSPAGRALFKSASQDKDGVIKIEMQDKVAAADMLNKLQSAYVTRSLNLNANVAVHAARDANPADAIKLFDAFGGSP